MEKIISKEIDFLGKKLYLETGKLANMTNIAVKASYGDTVVLVTVVAQPASNETDFFPLTINYVEKLYASGTVKSSRFVKRDGRGTDEATIAGRAVDHAIRPLFPKDYVDEVQIVATVMSLDEDCDPQFLTMTAVSAALQASDLPFKGPMITARVGYTNGGYILCPTRKQQHTDSDLDMLVSFVGEDKKYLAMEVEANILSEEKILGGVEFARNGLDDVYNLILDFAKAVNPENKKYTYSPRVIDPALLTELDTLVGASIKDLMHKGTDKNMLTVEFDKVLSDAVIALDGKYKKSEVSMAFDELKKKQMQKMILEEKKRADGRGITDVRPIMTEVGLLPRVHGSALFSRGITQDLTIVTLASPSQELLLQDMYGERSKRYMHYYNFPPYASGEAGRMGGFPKNREIGHGMIGENALRPVIPSQDDFPYTILVTSEILSSSGSTSMAATCGSSLALMDAGVPIKDLVGGVGVGLIANDDFSDYLILTDLAYMEDAFGFMDFKMTGTRTGVTAIQCDMKLPGIPMSLLPKIFEQSKDSRMKVLDEMEKSISSPRAELSKYAPKMMSVMIDPDKIGMVIGSGGKTIKELQEKTNTEIFIEEIGRVTVSGKSSDEVQAAIDIISGMTKDVKPGEIYDGTVTGLLDFGALVEILPGKVGLLHISEITNQYVSSVQDYFTVGQAVKVRVLEAGHDGKISLSSKEFVEAKEADPNAAPRPQSDRPQRSDRRPSGDGRRHEFRRNR